MNIKEIILARRAVYEILESSREIKDARVYVECEIAPVMASRVILGDFKDSIDQDFIHFKLEITSISSELEEIIPLIQRVLPYDMINISYDGCSCEVEFRYE